MWRKHRKTYFSDFRLVFAKNINKTKKSKTLRILLWWSQQDSHFNSDPAFSINITEVSWEVTYDIGVYMVGGTEYLMPFLESTFINMVAHGN